MLSYDPIVIEKFAQKLYGRATSIVLSYSIVGIILGAAAGLYTNQSSATFVLAGFAGVVGFLLGSQKAFLLKLQAQTVLCQVQIEKNTRNVAGRSTAVRDEAAVDLESPETLKSASLEQAAGSRRAAQNLAASGHTEGQISKELQKWRGLSAVEANELAKNAKGES